MKSQYKIQRRDGEKGRKKRKRQRDRWTLVRIHKHINRARKREKESVYKYVAEKKKKKEKENTIWIFAHDEIIEWGKIIPSPCREFCAAVAQALCCARCNTFLQRERQEQM